MRRGRRRPGGGGFTLLEVTIALFLIVMVWVSALASMRGSLRSLTGSESTATAATAVRELREYTYDMSIDQLDLLDGQSMAPVLGDGAPMPETGDLVLDLDVQAVDDSDPSTNVLPAASRTRLVTVVCWSRGRL
ncbi:MAG: hypothetical protein ISR76_01310, partial [Planctomycetes bacterium]|nr:hypothetical protein [Planctomycetota bacterium]